MLGCFSPKCCCLVNSTLCSLIITHQHCVASSYYAEAEPRVALADIYDINAARYNGTCKRVRGHRTLSQVRRAMRSHARALIGCEAARSALISWWDVRWQRGTAAGGRVTGRMTGELVIACGIDWSRKSNVEILWGARLQFILFSDPSILTANTKKRTKRHGEWSRHKLQPACVSCFWYVILHRHSGLLYLW